MSKHLEFAIIAELPKTKVFSVKNKDNGTTLGTIRWHGAWRQYVFEPVQETIWSSDCLQDLTDYLKKLKEERKK